MGIYSLKLPDLGEGVAESEVVTWYVAQGDQVEEDQPLVDIMTDKATVEVTSPVKGHVAQLACAAGEVLAVGQELIRLEVEGPGNIKATPEPETPKAKPTQKKKSPSKPNPEHNPQPFHASRLPSEPEPRFAHRTVLTSPSIRAQARERGIDLSMIPGSGPEGRIEQQDLDTFVALLKEWQPEHAAAQTVGTTTINLSGLRKIIAEKMSAAKKNIPHFSYVEEIDVTELVKLRQQLNHDRETDQSKLTLLPFVIRALINVLPQFPQCNAHFNGDNLQLTQFDSMHIGVATMTEQGLLVPVIQHAETLSLQKIAGKLQRLTTAAKTQRATRKELTGSTITLTSLGALGGLASTPIINAPETSIIGINKIQSRAVVKEEQIVVRQMMNLSASFDHRVVDGYDGAKLIQTIKEQLENPSNLTA